MANDFDALLQRVIREARAVKIPVSRRIAPHVEINTRATGRFGCCRKTAFGYTIELTDRLRDAPERACLQTLAHEILHTCAGCRDHGERWKSYAARMNAAYGYDVHRTDTCEALGVADTRRANWAVRCLSCGKTITRQRRSALITHPERYRCRCGGRLIPVSLTKEDLA